MPSQNVVDVREFTPADVETFRALRLEALSSDADAFGSTAEEYRERPLEIVRVQLEQDYHNPSTCIVGAFDGVKAVGMVGLVRMSGLRRKHRGIIWGVYVTASYRRMGIAQRMLNYVIEFASTREYEVLQLAVNRGNDGAHHLYLIAGFFQYGIEPKSLKVGDRYIDQILMAKVLK